MASFSITWRIWIAIYVFTFREKASTASMDVNARLASVKKKSTKRWQMDALTESGAGNGEGDKRANRGGEAG